MSVWEPENDDAIFYNGLDSIGHTEAIEGPVQKRGTGGLQYPLMTIL